MKGRAGSPRLREGMTPKCVLSRGLSSGVSSGIVRGDAYDRNSVRVSGSSSVVTRSQVPREMGEVPS